MVKIYGAGGYQRLEDYQSGLLISPDGRVLTVYSSVLDTNNIDVYLSDGRKFEARFLGADPRVEIALLKIDAVNLPYFDLAGAAKAELGENVFALSNLFNVAVGNEPLSVQSGIVSAITTLYARRGAYETPYHGTVYVLDETTNNPGSAGGALVNHRGELLAVLGKELRSSQSNIWLNYAIPIEELRSSVESICAGKFVVRRAQQQSTKTSNPLDLESLGIVLVPDVLERTPPYVDYIFPGSPAEKAGILPDDLIVLINGR
ncbi:MAG: S1C family serine protease, partial [Thermoguttaceae bacterium]